MNTRCSSLGHRGWWIGGLILLAGGCATPPEPGQSAVQIPAQRAAALAAVGAPAVEIEAAWQSALAAEPGSVTAHRHLGLLLRADPNRREEMVRHLQFVVLERPDDAEAWEALADGLGGSTVTAEAVANAYQQAVRLQPARPDLQFKLGGSYERLPGKQEEALAAYRAALDLDPNHAGALNGVGFILAANRKRPAEALPWLERAVAIAPGAASHWTNLATTQVALGKFDAAITSATKALALDPQASLAYSSRAQARTRTNDLRGALADTLSALELRPTDQFTWSQAGYIRMLLDDLDGAIAALTKAIELQPNFARAIALRARCLWLNGRPEQALVDSTLAIGIDPKTAINWRTHADVLARLARPMEAEAAYDRALSLNPRDAECWYLRGDVRRRLGKLPEAIADFAKALRLDPRFEIARRRWVDVMVKIGRADDALAELDREVATEPSRPISWLQRGKLRQRLGDFKGAKLDFLQVVSLEPTNQTAKLGLLDVKLHDGEYASAVADLDQLIREEPENFSHYQNRGNAYYASGNFQAALDDFAKAKAAKPNDSSYLSFWIYLLERRLTGKADAQPVREYQATTRDAWGKAVATFVAGLGSEDELISTASSANPETQNQQRCEAYYYAGMMRLLNADRTGARQLFERCLATNVYDFYEYVFAQAELRLLNEAAPPVTPPPTP